MTVDREHQSPAISPIHEAVLTPQSAPVPVPIALAALVLAHLFDLLSFMVMTGRHGLDSEANPIVVRLFDQLGMPGLTFAKALAVVLGCSVFVVLAPKSPRLAMTVLVFGVGAGLVGGITNLASL